MLSIPHDRAVKSHCGKSLSTLPIHQRRYKPMEEQYCAAATCNNLFVVPAQNKPYPASTVLHRLSSYCPHQTLKKQPEKPATVLRILPGYPFSACHICSQPGVKRANWLKNSLFGYFVVNLFKNLLE